jgi:adenylate kinase family enzyme
MKRVAVLGTSGSGKSTLGRTLAATLGVPFVELDALHWGPGWTEASPEELRARVEPIVESDAWVVDGAYRGKLGDLVLERAEVVVWLDLPLHVWLPRLVRRTLRRALRRETFLNGNRESLRSAFASRDSLLLYALRTYRARRRRYPYELARFPTVRLRSRGEVERFLRDLQTGARVVVRA